MFLLGRVAKKCSQSGWVSAKHLVISSNYFSFFSSFFLLQFLYIIIILPDILGEKPKYFFASLLLDNYQKCELLKYPIDLSSLFFPCLEKLFQDQVQCGKSLNFGVTQNLIPNKSNGESFTNPVGKITMGRPTACPIVSPCSLPNYTTPYCLN